MKASHTRTLAAMLRILGLRKSGSAAICQQSVVRSPYGAAVDGNASLGDTRSDH